MLLRLSGAEAGEDVAIDMVTAGAAGQSGVAHGPLLVEFAEAVLSGGDGAVASARQRLEAAMGSAGGVEAVAVVAMFCFNDRVADATGTPIDRMGYKSRFAIARELGIAEYAASEPLAG